MCTTCQAEFQYKCKYLRHLKSTRHRLIGVCEQSTSVSPASLIPAVITPDADSNVIHLPVCEQC